MALIKCRECGHMISDKATKCPKCGCPTTKGTEHHIHQETPQGQPFYYENKKGGRFRKWLYDIIALLVALIAGGGYWWYSQTSDEREVKQFVEKFAKAVELGDKQTIQLLYPKSDGAESLHVSYYVDSMSIVHPTGNDTIDVKLSHSQSIQLAKDAKRQMYIVSSKGLFDFSKEEIDFAIKTGWINSSLDDAVKAERLKDKEFIPWIEQKAISLMKENFKVVECSIKKGPELNSISATSGIVAYNCTVVVGNNSKIDIPADAYVISVYEKGYYSTWWPDEGESKENYSEHCKNLSDKVIPKHGTASFSWIEEAYEGAHSMDVPQSLMCKIIFEPNKDDAIAAYESTGKEYLEYLEWKNNQKKTLLSKEKFSDMI